MKVTFLGVGAAADIKYETSSILVEEKSKILLDCGYGIVRKIARDSNLLCSIDAIYISHVHFDHAFGIQPLGLFMRTAGRTKPLTVFCHKQIMPELKTMLNLDKMWEGTSTKLPFKFELKEVESKDKFNEFTLDFAKTEHGPMTNYAIKLLSNGKSLVYSGDGNFSEDCKALYKNIDLVIHECFKADIDTPGHATGVGLLNLQMELGFKALGLIHFHSESRSDSITKLKKLIKMNKQNAFVPEAGTQLLL